MKQDQKGRGRGRWQLVLLLGAISAAAARADSPYVLEKTPGQHMQAVLTFEIHCPQVTAQKWVAFVCQAPELPSQSNVRTRMTPAGEQIRDSSPWQRPVLRAIVPVKDKTAAQTLPLRITFEADLHGRRLRLRKPGEKVPPVPELQPREKKAALLSQGGIDFDTPVFQRWLDENKLRRQSQESDIDFARRVFPLLRRQFRYDYQGEMNRQASAVCQAGRSDCGGLSAVFAAVMRANDIPARCLYGRWAMSANPDEKINGTGYYQWHVQAEFYARDVGWVPVDLALAVVRDNSRAGLRYFGVQSGNFFTMHIDPDVVIDTVLFGAKHVAGLQRPGFYVSGSGSVEPMELREGWTVENGQ